MKLCRFVKAGRGGAFYMKQKIKNDGLCFFDALKNSCSIAFHGLIHFRGLLEIDVARGMPYGLPFLILN